MYRVQRLLARDAATLKVRMPSCYASHITRQLSSAPSSTSASSSAASASTTAAASSNPTPTSSLPPRTWRRLTVSERVSPTRERPQPAPILTSTLREAARPRPWYKQSTGQRYSHLGKGVFHLVPQNVDATMNEDADGTPTEASFELLRGVSVSNLFKQPASIHRIIGFERDIIEESRRDTTATAEVALVGRSNVGKSSLLNALLLNGGDRKQLAVTSRTPGRTQLLFMFSFLSSRETRIVDCPGYGYAKAKKAKKQAWNRLMGLYLRQRAKQGILKRVLVLIDIRRCIGPLDELFIKFLEAEGIAYQIVLTKVDCVSPQTFQAHLEDVRAHLRSMPHGRFNSDESRDRYEENQKGIDDGEDADWQTDVNTGEYSTSSLDSNAPLPSYSCCVPIIHAVSTRQDQGIAALQQGLTKMLTLEPNARRKAYQPEGDLDGEEEQQLDEHGESVPHDEYANEGAILESDGMDNEIDESEQYIPHIPVQHYDEIDPAAYSKASSSSSSSSRSSRKSAFASKRSKFGARSGKRIGAGTRSMQNSGATRSFTTSAKPPRSSSTPPADRKEKSEKTPRKPRASKAAPASIRDPRSQSTPPSSSTSNSSPADDRPLTSATSAAPSSATTPLPSPSSTPNDVHLGSIYQKKTQRQHILDRSETYIGSMHHQHSAQWIYSETTVDGVVKSEIVQKECMFVPSLVHIFDEILVNAADNQHRSADATDPSQAMTTIRVDIDQASGRISIANDGASIPVAIHPTEKIPIPELIFGHLLTSSNYNDKEQRFTGGRHGYGAKLTNIFSREFKIEIQDTTRQMRYEQSFTQNMGEKSAPIMQSFSQLSGSKKSLSQNSTKISFIPDFARFNEKGLTDDTVAIMKKRVFDIAACVNTNISIKKLSEKTKKNLNPQEESDSSSTPSLKRIKVYLNDVLVEVDSFPKYLDLFPAPQIPGELGQDDVTGKWIFNNVNSNWQVGVGLNVAASAPLPLSSSTPTPHDSNINTLPSATRDISFVNSIYTSRGGTHVNHVSDRITRAIIEHILKVHGKTIKKEMISIGLVKSHISLLVNCKIPNPSFSSQTKESLMTPVKDFGSECTLSQAFLAQITSNSTGIVPAIVDSILSKQQIDLLRKSRSNTKRSKILQIPKLEDANWAGSSDPEQLKQTTLILTEGDSAKALVLSALPIIGRDRYGIFPLKGKLLNVRDASLKQIMENAEIQNILAIVGLEIGANYSADAPANKRPSKPLRYSRIMLMTDQDHDGSHIKGLFINLLHTFWPELLVDSTFLEEFITAIIKVRNNRTKEVISFSTQTEFETWKTQLPIEFRTNPEKFKRQYTIKYYKGLGTNTNEEGKEYFRNIKKHRVKFVWEQNQVKQQALTASSQQSPSSTSLLPSSTSDAGSWIRLAFSKDQSDARKEWLTSCYNSSLFVDTSSMQLSLHDFINKELIVFSHADNIRSIPNIFDGLKPVQRKVLYGCFKRGNLGSSKNEIKVAQLSGYISEQTMYHHGEVSLQGSIVNMAQAFIGSNNIPLLVGSGQFGSRNTGGKDAAAARYIYTSLSPITRTLFHVHDDALLTYNDEDGYLVEPEYYVPVIPTILVNGAEGIGTGFSTYVPTFNPKHLIENIRRFIRSEPMQAMHPWIRGWRGIMKPTTVDADQMITNYTTEGIIQRKGETTYEVLELPHGRWPEEFKSHLTFLLSTTEIKRFADQSSDEQIRFRIDVTPDQARIIEKAGALKFFKLTSSLSMNNMHLFNGYGIMHKYRSALDILAEFITVRLEYYRRRREYLLIQFEVDLKRVANKIRFIDDVTSGKLAVYNKKKVVLMAELKERRYETILELQPRFPIYKDHTQQRPTKYSNDIGAAKIASLELDSDSYDYLLNMPLSTLTAERLGALKNERDSTAQQLEALEKTQPKAMWLQDLDKLEQQWIQVETGKRRGGRKTIDAEVDEEEEEEQ